MKRQDFRFFHQLRVRWAEVDMQKIVFNAHYLMYFDTSVSEYWRALGLPYEDAMQQLGGELYLKKATVEFNASARMDDRLDVAMKCTRIGNSSMLFTGAIFRAEELLVTCEMVCVFADPATQTSKAVPQALREVLTAYEAGQPMVRLSTGSWDQLSAQASRIRTSVFVEEQKIPAEMEWDEADATAVHAVVQNLLGQPLGTARLLQASPGVAKVGRMAVHHGVRGTGIGKQVLLALLNIAAGRGDTSAVLHAQRTAENFYRRLGFVTHGEPFSEAGIPHVEMTARLPLRS